MMKFLSLCFCLFLCGQIASGKGDGVEYKVSDVVLPTHPLTPNGPLPSVYDPDGVYPYMSYSETAERPFPKKYRTVILENAYLSVTICPDLCGKVLSIIHKPSGREVLYTPGVIKGTRILPRFYFTAGGIEVSFPISHSPTQNDPIQYSIQENGDRVYVCCGDREQHFGMQWTVEYSLGPDDRFLTERVVYHNPGRASYPWMSWSNAAIPSAPDTHYLFPSGKVLSHSSQLKTIDWDTEGIQYEKDIKEMTGYFWQSADVNAFGAFTPSLGVGLFHVADEHSAPGIKLWSYGVEDDKDWAMLSTPAKRPYVELQGGPARDQSIKQELHPGESHTHTEFWIPSDKELDIKSLQVPHVQLRPLDEVPLFNWENSFWLDVLSAFHSRTTLPPVPAPLDCVWAPSGMEELADAFEWAIAICPSEDRDAWLYYYGVWLAGREEADKAINTLLESRSCLARAVSARIFAHEKKNEEAVQEYVKIPQGSWLNLIPQFVCERDRVLASFGKLYLDTREAYLDAIDASHDEWVGERRVQLLVDQGNYNEAEELLLSINFQKVHQTYIRTDLWNTIQKKLKRKSKATPASLGEDRLARFGAYREYEE